MAECQGVPRVYQYIERALKDSHKWKDTEEVNKILQEIDLEDKIVRHNDRYLRMI